MSEQPMSDSKFSRNFVGMLIAMTILTAILMVLASINASDVNDRLQAEKDAEKLPSIVEQIAPIGKVAVGAVASAIPEAQAEEELDGGKVYNGACAACHGAGIAGAPVAGDASQWTTRIAQGIDTLYANAINGIGAMPAKGGQSALSDDAVKAAVDYIIETSK